MSRVEHGTVNRYRKGCRCGDCRSARRAYDKQARADRIARAGETPHGTQSGYLNWACKCAPCVRAYGEAVIRTWTRRLEQLS